MTECIDDPANEHRRQLLIATSVVGGAAAVSSTVPFVASMAPSERARAAGAPVSVDIGKLAPGEMMTVGWRGMPVWILHRTPAMIAGLRQVESQLLAPESTRAQQPEYCRNTLRSRRPEYLVAIGLCTHLGCVPTFRPDVAPADLGAQWQGGYYCPCHGSRFDLAGRVYRNVPAPLNLVVPQHDYDSTSLLTIGQDQASA